MYCFTRLSRNLQVYRGTELHDVASSAETSGVVFFVYEGLDSSKTKMLFVLYKSSPDLPSNGSSLRDLDCSHSNYQT
jgi:hypothetical protein